MRVSISLKGKEIDEISIEGTNGDLFYEASPKKYRSPSIVKEDLTFLGVPLEYAFADKILAITSELKGHINTSSTHIPLAALRRTSTN